MVVTIAPEDFDPGKTIQASIRPQMGGIVTFLGVVRDDGINEIELEAFGEAALQELLAIREDAMQKFSLISVDIIHRIGVLRIGDHILLIVVGAGHRQQAFMGCEYILERIKMTVPIWKKETTPDGTRWVRGDYEP
ncbi:MAG: molybdenum cofactor biosynthesis protein MoaE [Methanoregulaceae archaeon]|nr:molybdenum cofactor biosynthesis protein MoaE [Methanoregulaceae archaeon]